MVPQPPGVVEKLTTKPVFDPVAVKVAVSVPLPETVRVVEALVAVPMVRDPVVLHEAKEYHEQGTPSIV